jgi:hypothetical protein
VDSTHDPVQIFDESFDPSRILFTLAPEAYKLYLAEYSPEGEAEITEADAGGQ